MMYNNIIHGARSKNIITNNNKKKNLIKSKRSRALWKKYIQFICIILVQGWASSISSQN